MRFALIISVVIVGSQATPQFSDFNLGDLFQSARNQVRNAISQIRTPIQRNSYRYQSNVHFGQSQHPNNNYDRQMSQADQELWAQCSILFAAHPERDWRNPNPSHIYNGFTTGQLDVNYPPQGPSEGLNGPWENQQSQRPLQQPIQEGPRQPGPGQMPFPGGPPHGPQHHHRPGHMQQPGGPPHDRQPGPPFPTPPRYQTSGGENGLENCQQEATTMTTTTTTRSVSPAKFIEVITTPKTISEGIIQDNRIAATPSRNDIENSVVSTTEFDWNNFYLGASANNTGGAGSIDVRGDFK